MASPSSSAPTKPTTDTTTTTTNASQQQQQEEQDDSSPFIVTPSPTKGIKVDAAKIARPFREEIKLKVQKLKESGIEAPLLVGLLANTDPSALQYANWTARACRADGLRYDLRTLTSPLDVENALNDANDDPRVHGIIVYYPIFGAEEGFSGQSQDDYLRDTISYKCDVEGLCHTYRTNLYRNVRYLDYPSNTQKCLLPCTALSVVKILECCTQCYDPKKPIGKKMEKQVVTVINRSEIVGRPLAAMVSNDGAVVYSVDISSIYKFEGGRLEKCVDESPESCVRKSSVVITGVPTKSYRLPTEWIQPNTTVINVASYKNVDETKLLQIPGVVYVPMVGKVTVAMLERNLMRLYENFHQYPMDRSRRSSLRYDDESSELEQRQHQQQQPWYGSWMQVYTAAVVTAMLAVMVTRK